MDGRRASRICSNVPGREGRLDHRLSVAAQAKPLDTQLAGTELQGAWSGTYTSTISWLPPAVRRWVGFGAPSEDPDEF